ncbi:hypothetical protein F4819DRAFT_6598 [Hypoxylon fuscum]|nr:hypothetical protein F4819DRAFT_6598 [Hypoxylon fuscum]
MYLPTYLCTCTVLYWWWALQVPSKAHCRRTKNDTRLIADFIFPFLSFLPIVRTIPIGRFFSLHPFPLGILVIALVTSITSKYVSFLPSFIFCPKRHVTFNPTVQYPFSSTHRPPLCCPSSRLHH